MATTVLDETNVLLDEEHVFGEEEPLLSESMRVLERIAQKYRAMGYDAEFVIEDGDDLDFDKYFGEDFMREIRQ